MIPLAAAVQSLRPGAQFVIHDDDIEGITWHTDAVEPLTRAEVDAEVSRLEAEATQRAADRAEGLRKMAQASGLTPDELAALGL